MYWNTVHPVRYLRITRKSISKSNKQTMENTDFNSENKTDSKRGFGYISTIIATVILFMIALKLFIG